MVDRPTTDVADWRPLELTKLEPLDLLPELEMLHLAMPL